MCKSEIFAKIIALVSKGTEIPTELIVSDNRVTEIVTLDISLYIFYTKKDFIHLRFLLSFIKLSVQ